MSRDSKQPQAEQNELLNKVKSVVAIIAMHIDYQKNQQEYQAGLVQEQIDWQRGELSHLAEEAVVKGDAESLAILLKAGVNPDQVTTNQTYPSMLLLASSHGHSECVQLLVEAGANVNVGDCSDTTPLMHVCEAGDYQSAKLLIARGADVFATDEQEYSPLVNAIISRSQKCIALLTKATTLLKLARTVWNEEILEAFVGSLSEELLETRDGVGSTALMIAAERGSQSNALSVFISAGMNINAKDKNGKTALMRAVETVIEWDASAWDLEKLKLDCDDDGFTCIKKLVRNGADLEIKDKNGKTALQLISEQKPSADLSTEKKARFIEVQQAVTTWLENALALKSGKPVAISHSSNTLFGSRAASTTGGTTSARVHTTESLQFSACSSSCSNSSSNEEPSLKRQKTRHVSDADQEESEVSSTKAPEAETASPRL